MKQYFDSNIVQQLVNNINKGWRGVYLAKLDDRILNLYNTDDFTDPTGRLFVSLDPEQYGENTYGRYVVVEPMIGNCNIIDGVIKNQSQMLRITFCANRGEINTNDSTLAWDLFSTMKEEFETQLTHLVYPHRSYVEWDKHFPISWLGMLTDSKGWYDFQITGTGYIPIEAYGTTPGVMDLDELSKLIIHFVQPTESLMGYDWYSDVAKTGIITDSFVTAGAINE